MEDLRDYYEPDAYVDTEKMSVLQRIAGIVTSPAKTMRSLVSKPGLLFPMLLIVLAPLVILLTNHASIQDGLRKYVDMANSQAKTPMTASETDAFIKNAMSAIPVLMPFFLELMWVGATAVIFGIIKLFRGKGSFDKYLSVTGYSLVITAIYFVLMALLSLATGSFELKLSLGTFITNVKGSYTKGFFSGFLGAIDLFALWYLYVVGIGVITVSGLSKRKVYTILGVLFAILTVLSGMLAGSSAMS